MRLAWYTPYSQRSAIGLFSKEVVSSLIELGHEVTIVRSESPCSDWSKTSREEICEVITAESIDSNVVEYLHRFDCVLYNVGNHFQNHYYCLSHQQKVPGITILHDYLLHNLLVEWLAHQDGQTYIDVLMSEAGAEAVKCYHEASINIESNWFMSRSVDFPVMKFAMQNTFGVITHAQFYSAICRSMLHCPVKSIPLAYCCRNEQLLESPEPTKPKLSLLTIGDVNCNKRCESVIRALGGSRDLSSRWEYRIVGNISQSKREKLVAAAISCPYPVNLVILGKVDDESLQQELQNANAIACLRQPNIEGASASVIVSLASARPTLVSDGGCFAEIPQQLIYRIASENEIGDIRTQLQQIASDYSSATQRALRAREWAIERHSGEKYAKSLLPFVSHVLDGAPVLQLTDTVARYLATWNCHADNPAIPLIDSEIKKLFGELAS